jgi:GNAT superfamily N-acetyltransferase
MAQDLRIALWRQVTAVILAWCNETSYLSAFDPRHEAFGFGRELLARAIRHAHEHRYRCWNFSVGTDLITFLGGRGRPKSVA